MFPSSQSDLLHAPPVLISRPAFSPMITRSGFACIQGFSRLWSVPMRLTFLPVSSSNMRATTGSSIWPAIIAGFLLMSSGSTCPVFSRYTAMGPLYLLSPRMAPASLPPMPCALTSSQFLRFSISRTVIICLQSLNISIPPVLY